MGVSAHERKVIVLVVDSQVHTARPGQGVWPPLAERLSVLNRGEHCFPDIEQLTVEMGMASVSAAVLVPPLAIGEQPDVGPWIADADRYPGKFCVMARVRTEGPPARAAIEATLDLPEVKGIRLSFHGSRNNADRLLDGSLDWLWRTLDEAGAAVMINAPGMVPVLADIARRHQGLRLIVDHLAIRSGRHDELRSEVAPLAQLAPLPNVAVKASALPTTVGETYPFPAIATAVRDVIGWFGADRVMWGSDLSRLPCSYPELVTFFMTQLDGLSSVALEEVMGLSVLRWLNWAP